MITWMSCGILPTSEGTVDGVSVSVLRDTGCSGVVVVKKFSK